MTTEHSIALASDCWSHSGPQTALQQIADLLQQCTDLAPVIAADRLSFSTKDLAADDRTRGILSAEGTLVGTQFIVVKLKILHAVATARFPASLFNKLTQPLSDRIRLIPPAHKPGADECCLWVELKVQATPLSLGRSDSLLAELRQLKKLAIDLEAELPGDLPHADLLRIYEPVSAFVEPLNPAASNPQEDDVIWSWACETMGFLDGTLSVAVATECEIAQRYALAWLARACQVGGRTLGHLLLTGVNPRGLTELARKAPGLLVVPAARLNLGSNPYDLSSETQAMLQILSSNLTPAIFTGSYPELQRVFHGGQGGANHPGLPVVRKVPDIQLEKLVMFALQLMSEKHGGLPQKHAAGMTARIAAALAAVPRPHAVEWLQTVTAKELQDWASGTRHPQDSTRVFLTALTSLKETLGGLSQRARVQRDECVQQNFLQSLTDSTLSRFLQDRVLGQQQALNKLVTKLRVEALTRPLHQPLRYCAQGTPATGKSESARLLAHRLNVPFVNIDAASMPDFYTASAQLLGSGRGIVGSHQSGRLEQAAKHFRGAVIEISDLDHAVPNVRAALADLFLQVLETGEAQSATGAMFSCANLIFAFTMNLPNNTDETVRTVIGFDDQLPEHEVEKRVVGEIKNMLSNAFLSRVGAPILFEPLSGRALGLIIERTLLDALQVASERLHITHVAFKLSRGLGQKVLATLGGRNATFGARGILERARSLTTAAVLGLQKKAEGKRALTLAVHLDDEGNLHLSPSNT